MREAHSEVDPKSHIFFAREARKKIWLLEE